MALSVTSPVDLSTKWSGRVNLPYIVLKALRDTEIIPKGKIDIISLIEDVYIPAYLNTKEFLAPMCAYFRHFSPSMAGIRENVWFDFMIRGICDAGYTKIAFVFVLSRWDSANKRPVYRGYERRSLSSIIGSECEIQEEYGVHRPKFVIDLYRKWGVIFDIDRTYKQLKYYDDIVDYFLRRSGAAGRLNLPLREELHKDLVRTLARWKYIANTNNFVDHLYEVYLQVAGVARFGPWNKERLVSFATDTGYELGTENYTKMVTLRVCNNVCKYCRESRYTIPGKYHITILSLALLAMNQTPLPLTIIEEEIVPCILNNFRTSPYINPNDYPTMDEVYTELNITPMTYG
jgi:hypothetical protein